MGLALLESCITTSLRMTNSNAGFTGTEISPVGSSETLGKDGPTCDFSVIRQKDDSVNGGGGGRNNQQAVRLPVARKKVRATKQTLNLEMSSKKTSLTNNKFTKSQFTMINNNDINYWRQMEES